MKKITVNKAVIAFIHEGTSVLDDRAFGALSIADKTKVMTELKPPFLYVETFSSLSNMRVLKQKLLNGEDCSLELVYNGLEAPSDLSRVRKLYLDTVTPVLAAIDALTPTYPFAVPSDYRETTVENGYAVRGSYKIKLSTLKTIWVRASDRWAKHWSDSNVNTNGKRKCWATIENTYVSGNDIAPGQSPRYVEYGANAICIGCQSIYRYELEQFALSQGWVFPSVLRGKTEQAPCVAAL